MPALERLVRPLTYSSGERCLLVLLHGLGSDERDMFSLGSQIDGRYTVVALRAPNRYEIGGFAWFGLGWDEKGVRYDAGQARESLEVLRSEVRDLLKEWDVEPRRTVVGGFSQGAIMSLAVLLHEPDLVGGALLMSGAVLPELVPDQPPANTDAPVLAQHGLYDEVLPAQLGRGVRDLLLSFGYRPDYREYPMGHEVSLQSLQDAASWLGEFYSSK